MVEQAFERLIKRGLLSKEEFREITGKRRDSGKHPEELLREKGIPKHEMLFCLSEYFGYPFVEHDEGVVVGRSILHGLDTERLKTALWLPLSVSGNMIALNKKTK